MQITQHRRPLIHTRKALGGGRLTVGFIGGSITDARPRHNWPEPVIAWLAERYPGVELYVENAAIGATGSELAVFRAERDLIERGCDLVFVDYAVNDDGEPAGKRMRSREGLLRKLLADGRRDVALVYTYGQSMYDRMANDEMPDSIADFERLASHYGLGSVWMGLHALEEVKKGRMRWEEWLPDGLHPTARGSLSYGESVIAYLERELRPDGDRADEQRFADGPALPEPLDAGHWQHAYALPFERVEREGPWTIRRWPHLEWIDRVLGTSAVGSTLGFTFTGRGIVLGFDFGTASAEYKYRLDGGEWVTVVRERPSWCGMDGWFHTRTLTEELPAGEHRMDIEVVHGNRPDCKGTRFDLALIGILP